MYHPPRKPQKYQSGEFSFPENYHPISILPALSKILEKAVHKELMNYLEKDQLLNDSQYVLDGNVPPEWHQHCFVIIFAAE